MGVIPLLIIGGGLVGRERDVAGFDTAEILEKDLIVALDLLGGLAATHSPGDILPPVRRVLVKLGQSLLKQLVLAGSP